MQPRLNARIACGSVLASVATTPRQRIPQPVINKF
jgi:hypothetical protein